MSTQKASRFSGRKEIERGMFGRAGPTAVGPALPNIPLSISFRPENREAFCVDMDAVERFTGGHIQHLSVLAAEDAVGRVFRRRDEAKFHPFRREDVDP